MIYESLLFQTPGSSGEKKQKKTGTGMWIKRAQVNLNITRKLVVLGKT
jgi:hypothetical protein